MATKADLRNRILRYLEVLGIDQSAASADEAEAVDEVIDSVHEGLLTRGVVWFETSDIPSSMLVPLAEHIATYTEYYPTKDPVVRDAARKLTEREMRRLASGGRSPEPITAVYF